MNILDKIKIDDTEYICVQTLVINGEMVYKLCNSDGNDQKFVKEKQNSYETIQDEETLKKINNLTQPKTDLIITNEER